MAEDVYDWELSIKKNGRTLNVFLDDYPEELLYWIGQKICNLEHESGQIRVDDE